MKHENEIGNVDSLPKWLSELKALLVDIARRKRVLSELCPTQSLYDADRSANLRSLSDLNDNIEIRADRMRDIERDERIGCVALLADNVGSHPLYLATAVLIATRLNWEWRLDCRSVGEVMGLAAGGCPIASLTVRDAFREHGALLPWVVLSEDANLDLCGVDLTDAGFALACGRNPTDREYAISIVGNAAFSLKSHRRRS